MLCCKFLQCRDQAELVQRRRPQTIDDASDFANRPLRPGFHFSQQLFLPFRVALHQVAARRQF